MKEKLYTIPLSEAFEAQDECPFCFVEKQLEQDLLDFVLGSGASYMEADTRDKTDLAGFCRRHFQSMFHYGNTLGNAWILKTHYQRILMEMRREFESFQPAKTASRKRFGMRLAPGAQDGGSNSLAAWIQEKKDSCYICSQCRDTYARYLDTFFYLYEKEAEFRRKVADSKGFCLSHFGDLCQAADEKLSSQAREEFYRVCLPLMEENMERVAGDVAWMVEKFDYRNKDADWKNSRDAIQRGMQKLKGGYPADPVYKGKK